MNPRAGMDILRENSLASAVILTLEPSSILPKPNRHINDTWDQANVQKQKTVASAWKRTPILPDSSPQPYLLTYLLTYSMQQIPS
jgi:hypothetical protein